MREYRVDLLDFYRGDLSARRLAVLIRHLSAESAYSRALNGGESPWQRLEHLIADLWKLWAKEEHPLRAAMIEKIEAVQNMARVIELRTVHEKRRRKYGLG